MVGPKEITGPLRPCPEASGKVRDDQRTFSGNPITSTAGLATLAELEKPGTYDRLHRSGQRLRDGFREVCEMLETPVQVLGEGPIVDILFTDQEIHDYRSSLQADQELGLRVGVEMIKRGVSTSLEVSSTFLWLTRTKTWTRRSTYSKLRCGLFGSFNRVK